MVLKKGYSEADVGEVWVPRSEEEFLCAGWKLSRHGERRSGYLTEEADQPLVGQGSRTLPGRLMPVDGKILQRRGGALRFFFRVHD